jgi:hypothetical protein
MLSVIYANMLIVIMPSVTMLLGVMLRVVAPFTKHFKNFYWQCWMKETVAVEQHLKLSQFVFEVLEKKVSTSKCKKARLVFYCFMSPWHLSYETLPAMVAKWIEHWTVLRHSA